MLEAGRYSLLEGIRVLDFSRVFAVPACGQFLGDLGAEVIKVEAPGNGDEARYYGMTDAELEAVGGVSPSFHAFNRNKRSITLDLRTEAGRETAHRLIRGSDVLLHNFRVGTMEKFGLGAEAILAAHPRLVYGAFSAYGSRGAKARIGANDLALQAHSGLLHITGEADRPPVRVGTAAIDLHAGMALAAGILAALFHRERTGKGQLVETSLLQGAAHLMSYFYAEYWMTGAERQRMGTANHLSVPNQVFPTADGYVVIIAPSDEMWDRLARTLDPETLLRPEFETIGGRHSHRDAVIDAISAVTRTRSSDDLLIALGAAKVNVAKVNTIGEAAEDAQLADIGGLTSVPHADGPKPAVSMPVAFGTADRQSHAPVPGLGEDTRTVCTEYGIDDAEYDRLHAAGAFGPCGTETET
ncbi:CaiB/BaiF CoA transferase family protein [Palleronia abyssalis]|uniref:Acetyl-CoA:oxalate CoA-transferase n=1 Tax=Palleronia abyssalis TaxID=1501240 RepID=A0A2R8BZA5_9RHOB|nr:CoA transferase [Palleronia abyssalis]SPJ25426.1 Acetyl-CoA:oxalate CoA-transferase [Palleronia abyssalis]